MRSITGLTLAAHCLARSWFAALAVISPAPMAPASPSLLPWALRGGDLTARRPLNAFTAQAHGAEADLKIEEAKGVWQGNLK